jgi:N-acetylmuramoyl-L-alanine amidase
MRQRRPVLAAAWLAAAALLGGCASPPPSTLTTTEGGVPIDVRYSARAQDSRVLFLVIHYTVSDLPWSIKILTEQDVSAHYLLTDESPPRIYRLVDESRRAWHSGASAWKQNGRLNSSSIGIEIVHPGFKLGPDKQRIYQPFPKEQIDALIPLVQDIVKRHGILPERILGHGEVTPAYKEDPGPTFPWKRFSELGITPPWPDATRVATFKAQYDAALPDIGWFQRLLAQHGYSVPQSGVFDTQTQRVLMNFQMRYRPERYDGQPDAETAALLHVITHPLPAAAAPAPPPRPAFTPR